MNSFLFKAHILFKNKKFKSCIARTSFRLENFQRIQGRPARNRLLQLDELEKSARSSFASRENAFAFLLYVRVLSAIFRRQLSRDTKE